ncbi:MAG: hypothetical protein JRH20_26180 [Deltaproteobacteria bacterium]|nr:hypothetical protein [Deltaproteobacteria bacterium]
MLLTAPDLAHPRAFISEIKLDSHLSPTRTNGLIDVCLPDGSTQTHLIVTPSPETAQRFVVDETVQALADPASGAILIPTEFSDVVFDVDGNE